MDGITETTEVVEYTLNTVSENVVTDGDEVWLRAGGRDSGVNGKRVDIETVRAFAEAVLAGAETVEGGNLKMSSAVRDENRGLDIAISIGAMSRRTYVEKEEGADLLDLLDTATE